MGLQSSRGENLEQKSIPSCRGLVDGPITHHLKTEQITETRSRTNQNKDFKCSVEDNGETSEWFEVITGVKQGCNMSGFLFLLAMDWVMRRATEGNQTGIRWKITSKLEDLDFADDVALLSSTRQHMQTKSEKLENESRRT